MKKRIYEDKEYYLGNNTNDFPSTDGVGAKAWVGRVPPRSIV